MAAYVQGQNAGGVPQANVDMSAGEIKKLEEQARAQVVVATETATRAEAASKTVQQTESRTAGLAGGTAPSGVSRPTGGGSSAEASVYGEMAAQALGLNGIQTLVQFVDDRYIGDPAASGLDTAKAKGLASPNARTFDDMISDTLKAPGHYGASSGGVACAMGAGGLFSRAKIASASLLGQTPDALSTWSVKSTEMSSVKLAKEVTYSHQLASEQTLSSIKAVQPVQGAMMYMAGQMAPGMGMNGPTFRAPDVLAKAQEAREDKWHDKT